MLARWFLLSVLIIATTQIQSQRMMMGMDSLSQFNPEGLPTRNGNKFNDVWGFEHEGREYAILGNSTFTIFIDVTDPTSPVEIQQFEGISNTIWRDYKVLGNYAYGVCDSCIEGMNVFDLSDLPNSITLVANLSDLFYAAHNIHIDEENQRLYACGMPGTGVDLYIYDLSTTPEMPSLIATIDFNTITGANSNFYVHDLHVKDNIAYCSHGYTGFYVWDLNDFNNVELLGDFQLGGYNHSSWTTEDLKYAVVAEEYPLGRPMAMVSLENMGAPNYEIEVDFTFADHLIDTDGASTPHNPFIKDSLLYISYYLDGLKIYDISDPSNPILHAYFDSYPENEDYSSGFNGSWGTYPYLPSGNILISDKEHGLFVVKLSDPPTCNNDGIRNDGELGVDCGNEMCGPCPCDELEAIQHKGVVDSELTHFTDGSVSLGDTLHVTSQGVARFFSSQEIDLLQMLEVEQGGQLELWIHDCDTTINTIESR